MPFYIKQNDTRPRYVATLLDNFGEPDQAPINLTNATSVKFLMRSTGNAGSPKVTAAAAITSAASGIVTYTWVAGDTDTIGEFDVEFEITWSDGGVETVPNDGYLSVVIEDDLG